MEIMDTSGAGGRSKSEQASGSSLGVATDRPRCARGDVSVIHIVTAAGECFAERGVAQTRMDDVAQRAGVSPIGPALNAALAQGVSKRTR
jgi:Bacterial regulatory proteins, tetR family